MRTYVNCIFSNKNPRYYPWEAAHNSSLCNQLPKKLILLRFCFEVLSFRFQSIVNQILRPSQPTETNWSQHWHQARWRSCIWQCQGHASGNVKVVLLAMSRSCLWQGEGRACGKVKVISCRQGQGHRSPSWSIDTSSSGSWSPRRRGSEGEGRRSTPLKLNTTSSSSYD